MKTIITAFLRQAEQHPGNIAVMDVRGAITYDRMNSLSAYLAEEILRRLGGMDRRGRIALLLPRTKAFVVAQFAVLRAGCAVVPIDAEYPAERVRMILQDANCALCITTSALSAKVPDVPLLVLENLRPADDTADPEGDRTLDLSDPEAEGYILYTSGSTGKPKGVVHRQQMLNCTAETLKDVIRDPGHARSLNIAGFSFIAGLSDIVPMLTAGGSVYIAGEKERKNVDMLWQVIRKRGITGMFSPPQLYSVMRKLHGSLPLDWVLLMGEKYTADEPGDPGVWEGYGATEACPPVLLHPAGSGGPASLGKPCARTEVFLLDEQEKLIETPGVIGELCVSSPWLALGYNNLPAETARRFTEHPLLPGKRIYRTGDQMAWAADGSLVFHGRADRMVKVRGYRVELGEIDLVMLRRKGIREAVAMNVRVHDGDVIACYYTGEEQSPEDLKSFAATFLPDYMVPDFFIHLDSMPRTDRNKVDLVTIRAMEVRTEEAVFEPPKNRIERKACEAFAAALGMERFSAAADFFDFGGTSLSAAILISRLDSGFPLSFQDISAHPTPRSLAAYMMEKQGEKLPAMDRVAYPLTRTQMGIWLENMTGGNRETYTLPYMARAAEGISSEKLIQAVRQVLDAHPGMKYVIHTDADGMPCMILQPDVPVDLPVFEGSEENRLDFMKEFMPVVPMMDHPLFCPAVYKTPDRCYLAIKTHLVCMDATAISLFIAEMNRALAGEKLLGEDCTVQQAAMLEERQLADGTHDRAKEYFRKLFRDMEDIPALSGDLDGPLTPGVSELLRWEPGTLSAETVRTFCEKIRISESAFFMGAMALLLGKYLNAREVSFSTVYNGRPLSELSSTIGTLIKRIPVCGDLRSDLPVGDYLRGISRQLFNTMANDICSFDEVLKICPVNEDVEFIFQGDQFTDHMSRGGTLLEGDKWFMEHYHTGMVTGCMSIQLFSTGGLYNMTLEYRNEKFSRDWIRRFAQDLFTVAQKLMKASRIGEISLMTPEDDAKQARFNNTRIPMPFIPVHEQIRRHALSVPDKPAVIAGGKTLTFRDLDLLSSRLAEVIRDCGLRRDDLAGVLFNRDAWAYVAEIAVLKAGAGFLPFIPSYPDQRIRYSLEDSSSRLLLTVRACLQGRSLEGSWRILALEDVFGAELGEIRPDPCCEGFQPAPVESDQLAYCIYTSGSTGRPKGVMIEHGNIANYVNRNEKSIEIMHYAAPGRISLALASFSFDVSVVEAFVPLCNGNTVVIASEEEIHDPAAFARLIRQTGANGITCTPTYLMSLLEIPESREALREITFFDIGSEAFPRQLYDRLRELRLDSIILNVYGPTECTMGCSAALMTGGDRVTVGGPIANTAFYIADPFGNSLPVGRKGELVICGAQVGRGYVNPSEEKANAFFVHGEERAYRSGDLAAWTESGEIRIFGRIDSQVKLRGFRIELDEIEKVMSDYPDVSSSAAAVRKAGGTEYLAGWFTAKRNIPPEELRAFLQEKLPEYMVPGVLVRLDEMPMTASGKVDKKALPEPDLQVLKAEYAAPETELQQTLCAAFARSLNLDENRVGILDDFFALGGDSLRAMMVLAGAKLDGLTAADVFRLRTPAAIAAELEARAGRDSLPAREAASRLVPHPLSPLQLEMIDNQLFRPGSTMWSNMHFLARFSPDVDADRLCAAVNAALENHPALSVAFFFDDENELKQQYRPGLLKEVTVMDLQPETEDMLYDILILPFNRILNACLCKVNVFRGRKGVYLFMDVHHLLMDGGSLGVVLADIMNAYFGRELKPDYYFALLAEMEERAAKGTPERDRAWFRERYAGEDWCNIPPPDYDSMNISQAGRIRRLAFTSEQVAAAEAHWGVSHSVMAIAAGLKALSVFTGRQHVMLNWIFNNRLSPEAENAVGMLIRNLPAAVRMEEVSSTAGLLLSVKEQVAEGIAHSSWDFMMETRRPYINDCMEVNLQLGINADELDELPHEMIELNDPFSAAGARLEMELLENEYGDGAFDSEMEYAEGLFDRQRLEAFHDLYVEILEKMILEREP